MLALYLGGMGSRRHNFHTQLAGRLGFEGEATAMQRAFLDGRHGEAIAATSDELVDAMTVCGPPARVREKLAAYAEVGVTTLIVGVVPPTLTLRMEQLRLIAELAV
ncbi:MAG: LLM class flavin-dependent oxidoreductase, partial [Thermocrispum sp.]